MPCIDMAGTGANIKRICRDRGFRCKDIADTVGVTPVAVSKWMAGKNMPTIDNFVIIADMFRVAIDDIIVVTRT